MHRNLAMSVFVFFVVMLTVGSLPAQGYAPNAPQTPLAPTRGNCAAAMRRVQATVTRRLGDLQA